MSSRDTGVPELYLTLEELRAIAADLKEGFQREANQGIRKHSSDGQLQGLAALACMEAVDSFLYNCSLRAGEFAPVKADARKEVFNPPQRKRTRGQVTELPAPVSVVRKRGVGQ